MKRSVLVLAVSILAAGLPASAAPDAVKVTADNSYMVGYGSITGPAVLTAAVQNTVNADVVSCGTGPEQHLLTPVAGDSYLYVVAWSDDTSTSGVLLQVLQNGTEPIILSGTGHWEVYATGSDLDTGGAAPSVAQVQAQIALANGSGWATSTNGPGTGRLAVGESNDVEGSAANCPTVGNVFGIACQAGANGIGSAAKWMWYNPDPGTIANPFCADGTPRGEYLIFRYSNNTVPALSTWGMIALVGLLMGAGAWFLKNRA